MIRLAAAEDARGLAEVQVRAWWHAYADYVYVNRLGTGE